MNNQSTEHEKALRVLDNMAKAYKEKNMDLMMSLFSPDPDTILIGSGIDEKRTGPKEIREQFERDWEQSEDNEFVAINPLVFLSGSFAWIYTDIKIQSQIIGATQSYELRFSLVLEKVDDEYLIRHSHISFPCAWQPEGESYPL
jgi:ketosteroid isomerase-like protein